MNEQQKLNYERIAAVIRFIEENRPEQPKLEVVAEHVNKSPFHFQRIFGSSDISSDTTIVTVFAAL